MMFLLVMDVFYRMLSHASDNGMLQPIGHRGILHQCSLYADDAIIFLAPTTQDLMTTAALLELIPIYSLIAQKPPNWVYRALNKCMRGFLWAGEATAPGGK